MCSTGDVFVKAHAVGEMSVKLLVQDIFSKTPYTYDTFCFAV